MRNTNQKKKEIKYCDIDIYLDKEIIDELKIIAAEEKTTVEKYIVKCITEDLKKPPML